MVDRKGKPLGASPHPISFTALQYGAASGLFFKKNGGHSWQHAQALLPGLPTPIFHRFQPSQGFPS